MNYNVVLKSLPAVTVASMRTIMPSYDSYFEVIPEMGEEMNKKGAVCLDPPYCFNLYHDGEYREKDIDVEVCEAVVKACEDSEKVKYKNIPGIPSAACIMHKGPYSGLRDAYAFVLKWIEDNGYKMSGKPRESYLDGIWNCEDENDWLTEVQIPVELSEA
jgi:effector-binding domain-containing protein